MLYLWRKTSDYMSKFQSRKYIIFFTHNFFSLFLLLFLWNHFFLILNLLICFYVIGANRLCTCSFHKNDVLARWVSLHSFSAEGNEMSINILIENPKNAMVSIGRNLLINNLKIDFRIYMAKSTNTFIFF